MALMSAMLEALQRELAARFSADRVRADVVLAPFTTFKVGGPADLLFEPRSSAEFATALDIAHAAGVPFTVLGGGSNVLIGDHGIRGLVLRTRGGTIVVEAPLRVRADAAVTVNELVRWTVGRGLSGLEAWAGTPGTVGGGVYGNAHWGGRLLGDVIESVRLWQAGVVSDVRADQMAFGYDRSRLQRTGEVLLSARFMMGSGDAAVLRTVARQSLAYRKRTQPLHVPSAGCIFQNPGEDEAVPDGIPRSAGALVDRAGLKGVRIGAAVVSPTHANFIVNEGGATASEIRALVERCRAVVHERFGVRLRDEIVCVGEFGPQTEASSVHAAH